MNELVSDRSIFKPTFFVRATDNVGAVAKQVVARAKVMIRPAVLSLVTLGFGAGVGDCAAGLQLEVTWGLAANNPALSRERLRAALHKEFGAKLEDHLTVAQSRLRKDFGVVGDSKAAEQKLVDWISADEA